MVVVAILTVPTALVVDVVVVTTAVEYASM